MAKKSKASSVGSSTDGGKTGTSANKSTSKHSVPPKSPENVPLLKTSVPTASSLPSKETAKSTSRSVTATQASTTMQSSDSDGEEQRARVDQERKRLRDVERKRAQVRNDQANALTQDEKKALRETVRKMAHESSQRLAVISRVIRRAYIDPWHADIYDPPELRMENKQVSLLSDSTFTGQQQQHESAKRQRERQKKAVFKNTTPMHMTVLANIRDIVAVLHTIGEKLNLGMKFLLRLPLSDLALFDKELRGAREFFDEIIELLQVIWDVHESVIEFHMRGTAAAEDDNSHVYVPPDAHERCGEELKKLTRCDAIFSCERLLYMIARTNHSSALCRALASRTTAILLVAVENDMRDDHGRLFEVATKQELWTMLNESVVALPIAQSLASANEMTSDEEQLALSYAVLFPPPTSEVRPSDEQTEKALAAADDAAKSRRARNDAKAKADDEDNKSDRKKSSKKKKNAQSSKEKKKGDTSKVEKKKKKSKGDKKAKSKGGDKKKASKVESAESDDKKRPKSRKQ